MNTKTTELWDIFGPSRRDHVLCLLKLALEPDDYGDAALDLEAWCGVASDSDIARQQRTSGASGVLRTSINPVS